MLDGTYAGLSPLVVTNISVESHTVGLEKDGYTAVSRRVSISPGQATSLEIPLDPVVAATPSPTARSAGLVPAMAGALCIVILGIACSRRRNR
jgi:hypothetical protein